MSADDNVTGKFSRAISAVSDILWTLIRGTSCPDEDENEISMLFHFC